MSNVCRRRVCNLNSFSMTEKKNTLDCQQSPLCALCSMHHPILVLHHTTVPPVVKSGTTRLTLPELLRLVWLSRSLVVWILLTFLSSGKVRVVRSVWINSQTSLWITIVLIFKYLLMLTALITSHWKNVVLSLIADLRVCLPHKSSVRGPHTHTHTH